MDEWNFTRMFLPSRITWKQVKDDLDVQHATIEMNQQIVEELSFSRTMDFWPEQ